MAGAPDASAVAAPSAPGRMRAIALPNDRFTLPEIAFWLLPVIAFFAFPNYRVLGSQVLITGLFAVSLDLILGYAGIVSLGHAAFFGVGAYVTGILGSRYGLGFEATFPLSMLVPLLLALPVGLAVLRLESHYFALATLGIAQVLHLLAVNLPELTGGSNGLAGVPAAVLFGWAVPRRLPMAGLVWGLVGLGGLIGWRLARGRLGRSLAINSTGQCTRDHSFHWSRLSCASARYACSARVSWR